MNNKSNKSAELSINYPVVEGWKPVMESLVRHIEINTCPHDETHRGGAIWEICDQCGAEWADDRGGKPKFKWPDCVEKARQLLVSSLDIGARDQQALAWEKVYEHLNTKITGLSDLAPTGLDCVLAAIDILSSPLLDKNDQTEGEADTKALQCARRIMKFVHNPQRGGDAQLQAKIQCEISDMLAAPQPDSNELVERVAKAIHREWAYMTGWKPWVEGGNSFKQDEARTKARAALAQSPSVGLNTKKGGE